jgi:hypothetical protein
MQFVSNPYYFHPLTWWGMAICWLIAPFIISERWWIRLPFIAVFWFHAYLAFRLGIASFKWKRHYEKENSN